MTTAMIASNSFCRTREVSADPTLSTWIAANKVAGGRAAVVSDDVSNGQLPLPVTAVMGTIDEARNLRVVLPELRTIVREIVVVDDGSTDESRDVARAHGAVVVARPHRLGIGSAIYAGVAHASSPVIAALDGGTTLRLWATANRI